VLVGQDWGSPVAYNAALMPPRRADDVCAPAARGPIRPTDAWKHVYKDLNFYMSEVGHSRGYRNHARPTRIPAWHLLFDLGIVPDEDQWRSVWKSPESLSDTYTVPDELPPFLSQQALDYYVGEFTRTGIEPANNWYAAVDKSWEHVLPRQRSRPAASTFSDR
jgi:hypothetical protein